MENKDLEQEGIMTISFEAGDGKGTKFEVSCKRELFLALYESFSKLSDESN